MAPDAWFWAYDARPDQLDSLATPGLGLVRLSRYGDRYAALFHSGQRSEYRLDLDAAEASSVVDAIAVTVDDRGRFSVVTGVEATPTRLLVDLGEDEVLAVSGDILDVATYSLGGSRRYAAVVRDGGPSWILPDLSTRDLRARLDELDAVVTRLRSHNDRLTAVAAPGRSRWYSGLEADDVAHQLEKHRAYPVDLGAVLTPEGVRFTVVMR